MKKYNNIAEIPVKHYQGYIWDSGKPKPRMVDERFDFSTYIPESFIIEALLYSKEDQKTIHIRHSGKEHIYEYDLASLPEGAKLHDVKYLSHRRLKGVKKVHFKQLWIPEKDPMCSGMEVLKMKALIFTGFDNNKKS